MGFAFETDMTYAAGTLYARLRADSGAAWLAYVEHPFVAGLADGTLAREEFAAWLAQDYLYLVHYARAYALLVYKSGRVAEMAAHAALLHGLLHGEMSLHRGQLAAYGISPAQIEEIPETLELVAYSRYMLDRGVSGDVLDLSVTLAACLGGYGEIGLRLLRDPATRLEGNPYRDWIETYGARITTSWCRPVSRASRSWAGAWVGTRAIPLCSRSSARRCAWKLRSGARDGPHSRMDKASDAAMVVAPRGALARG